ncbi:hypothetical protein F2Q70_00010958 [Brassica cretica]|uniref:Uncharacterized protein n=1 Tax=Brassica cretica TaxID=69181 RepID=A0A8S9LZ86_BRACR|nr:hypothetical protein F2Q70_00010958 [Brassica cretica]
MSIRSCESNSEAEEESGGIRGFEENKIKIKTQIQSLSIEISSGFLEFVLEMFHLLLQDQYHIHRSSRSFTTLPPPYSQPHDDHGLKNTRNS